MAYRLRPEESVVHGLRRLAKKELRAARDELRRSTPPRDEAIHEARKSIKKVRAILQLVDADDGARLGDSQKRLRSVNRMLSRLRDADAMIEILSKLRKINRRLLDEHTAARVRRHLLAHKRAAMAKAGRAAAWKDVDDDLRKLRRAAKRWQPADRGFSALSPGIELVRREGRKAMTLAQKSQDAADFHEWRKQIKALWYALRLIEQTGQRVHRDVSALHQAETWLGDDHNVVVLCAELSKDASVCGGALQLDRVRLAGDRYQCSVRKRALKITKRIYAQASRKYMRGIKRAWKTWRQRVSAGRGQQRRRAAA